MSRKKLRVKCSSLNEDNNSFREKEGSSKTAYNYKICNQDAVAVTAFVNTYQPKFSTPIRNKDNIQNAKNSPEHEYGHSPVSLPLTQDGTNEVVWDWQNSLPSTVNNRGSFSSDTPKRRKLLQKKRNSNSPLLYKPPKRKLVKEKEMESMGQWKAELQALSEKVKTIQETEDINICNDRNLKENSNGTELIVDVNVYNSDNSTKMDSNTDDSTSQKESADYSELFDDSIDESMMICSQEIESKFQSCAIADACIITNNYTYEQTSCVQKIKSEKSNSILLDFPDDSFDDCLANCIEDDKLTPKTIKSTYNFKNEECSNMLSEANKFHSSNVTQKCNMSNKFAKSFVHSKKNQEDSHLIDITNGNITVQPNSITNKIVPQTDPIHTSLMENRKFFKTKCLSDSYFAQNNHANNKDKFGGVKSSMNKNLPVKGLIRAQSNSNIQSVSTNASIKFSSKTTTSSLSGLQINRLNKKEDNINVQAGRNIESHEPTKNSQTVHCTPEEIEKKRLEAKMKLEAKKRQASASNVNNLVNSKLIKKSIQRFG
ncbi:kinesin-related protein 8-like isoform X2 [Prorops nasuta]|uniref:kinesin-related protein 8-like isoform X2 n=1 Tax=Prorops nasuta TaxID=863751 RepID=UPI0034CFA7B9